MQNAAGRAGAREVGGRKREECRGERGRRGGGRERGREHPYTLPTPPPTVNGLYQVKGGRRFKRSLVYNAAGSPQRSARRADALPQRPRVFRVQRACSSLLAEPKVLCAATQGLRLFVLLFKRLAAVPSDSASPTKSRGSTSPNLVRRPLWVRSSSFLKIIIPLTDYSGKGSHIC